MRRKGLAVGLWGFVGSITMSAFSLDVKGLVLFLSFDEGGGQKIKDSGPFQLQGDVKGNTKWVNGKFGKAVELGGRGSGDYIEFPMEARLDATDAMTVSVWIRPNAWGAGCCDQVYGYGVHGGCGGRVQHGLFSEDLLKARFETTGGRLEVSTSLPKAGEWSHIVATYDGKVGALYLNGEKATELAGGGPPLLKGKEPFMVGGDCERVPQYNFSGAIDELVYFHRVLTPAEIKELFAKSVGGALAVSPGGKATVVWGTLKRF